VGAATLKKKAGPRKALLSLIVIADQQIRFMIPNDPIRLYV
jgi:hypothetical protein